MAFWALFSDFDLAHPAVNWILPDAKTMRMEMHLANLTFNKFFIINIQLFCFSWTFILKLWNLIYFLWTFETVFWSINYDIRFKLDLYTVWTEPQLSQRRGLLTLETCPMISIITLITKNHCLILLFFPTNLTTFFFNNFATFL